MLAQLPVIESSMGAVYDYRFPTDNHLANRLGLHGVYQIGGEGVFRPGNERKMSEIDANEIREKARLQAPRRDLE